MKNQNGFITIGILIVFPIIIFLSIWISTESLKLLDTKKIKKECFEKTLTSQNKIAKLLNKLLSYNPNAYKLYIKKLLLKKELLVAIAQENYPIIAKLTYEISKVEQKQVELNQKQQFILMEIQNLQKYSYLNTNQTVSRMLKNLSSNLFLNHTTLNLSKNYQIQPVQEEISDIASTYIQVPQLIEKTLQDFQWKNKFEFKSPYNHFIKIKWEEVQSCSVAIKFENQFIETKVVK